MGKEVYMTNRKSEKEKKTGNQKNLHVFSYDRRARNGIHMAN